mmetsp:Transcript_3246/g.4423  ORF Transcript_3246/g.4423 Transcript_3246/m.4423 type:complete len:257 (+) Transcript_3246:35-805(+)
MRLNVALRAGLCVFLMVGMASVRAEEDTDDVEVFDVDEIVDEDDDYEVGPSQDIETAFMFADYPDKKLELGEIIKVLFLFNNKGDIGFNVTHVFASLRSPYDYNYHIQNFSAMPIGTLVPPGAQASFEYLFKPDVTLEPTEFWLTTEVVYNSSEDRTYKSAVFNGTVELVEKNAEVDIRKFITYLVILAGMGYGGYSMYSAKKPRKSGDKKKTGAAKTVEIEEEKVELRKQARGQDGNIINRAVRRKSSKKKGRKN